MFVRYENIKDEVLIDCRTREEFERMPLFDKNIPIIDESTHDKIRKFYPCALFVILYSLFKNKEYLKNKLLEYSDNGKKKIIIGCSRGRLRSPILCLYARNFGIESEVLSWGIRGYYKKRGLL